MSEAKQERARVVAFMEREALSVLRDFCKEPDNYEELSVLSCAASLAQLADAIERGEHLKDGGA